MRTALMYIFLVLLVVNSCQRETARMTDYEVQGIDISHHQSYLNWDTIKSQQIDFAFIKATEADDFVDSLFALNWDEMARVGVKRGAYHFFRPTISTSQQIQNFISNVCLEAGDLPPVLDIETLDGLPPEIVVRRAQKWVDGIHKHYHIKPIIYSNSTFYNKYLAGHFEDVTLWIARYNKKMPFLRSGEWAFWQYGNKGKLEGVDGYIDFNVFRGSHEELEILSFHPVYSLGSFAEL